MGVGTFEYQGEKETVKCIIEVRKTQKTIGYEKNMAVITGGNIRRNSSELSPDWIRSMVSDVRKEWAESIEEEKEWEEEVDEALDDLE